MEKIPKICSPNNRVAIIVGHPCTPNPIPTPTIREQNKIPVQMTPRIGYHVGRQNFINIPTEKVATGIGHSLSGCLSFPRSSTRFRNTASYSNIRKRTSNPCNLVNVPVTTSNLENHRDYCAVPSLFVTNAYHIANKVDELSAVVAINNPSVILVTESWLSSDIPDSIINIGNTYNSYRLDRPTPGGGILAYIKSDLPAKRLPELEEERKEALWLLLKPPRTPRPYSSVIVVGVYHPTGQSKENELEMLDYLTQKMDIALAERPSAGMCCIYRIVPDQILKCI